MVGSKGGGGGGTGGGSGGGAAGGNGWKIQNAKGRARPDPVEWPLPSNKPAKKVRFELEGKGKGKGREKEEEDDSEEAFANLCREKFKDVPEVLQKVEERFPPKPKEPKQQLQEAMEHLDKSRAVAGHQAKMVQQMEAAYLRKAEELLEYKARVAAHVSKKEDADAALAAAKLELAQLQAKQVSEDAPFVAMCHQDPVQLVANYNPMQGIAEAMAGIPGIEHVPWQFSAAVQQTMQDVLRHHMQVALSQMRVAPTVQAAIHTRPENLPAAFPQLGAVVTAAAGGNATGGDSGGIGGTNGGSQIPQDGASACGGGHGSSTQIAAPVLGTIDASMSSTVGFKRKGADFSENGGIPELDDIDPSQMPTEPQKNSAELIREAEAVAGNVVNNAAKSMESEDGQQLL